MATKHPEHNALQDVKLAVCGEPIRSHSNFKLEKAFPASSERSTGANKKNSDQRYCIKTDLRLYPNRLT